LEGPVVVVMVFCRLQKRDDDDDGERATCNIGARQKYSGLNDPSWRWMAKYHTVRYVHSCLLFATVDWLDCNVVS
jgi:hypothetical protein